MLFAYRWMMEHHPHEPGGIWFVLGPHNKHPDHIESEYRRWKHGKTAA